MGRKGWLLTAVGQNTFDYCGVEVGIGRVANEVGPGRGREGLVPPHLKRWGRGANEPFDFVRGARVWAYLHLVYFVADSLSSKTALSVDVDNFLGLCNAKSYQLTTLGGP